MINADEMAKIANENNFTNTNSFISNIESAIRNSASEGGYSTIVKIPVSFINHNRQIVIDKFRNLGYKIEYRHSDYVISWLPSIK